MDTRNDKMGGRAAYVAPEQSNRGCVDSRRLRELRESRRLSRRDLAEKAGVSLPTISRLELRPAHTTTDTLVKLADCLAVPCGYLLGERVPTLDKYSLDDDLQNVLARFLDRLMAVPGDKTVKSRLLDAMRIFLDGDGSSISTGRGISEEEEVLGLWWSINCAYQRGDWERIVAKGQALAELAQSLGRPHLRAIARIYKAKAIRNRGGIKALSEAERELRDVIENEAFRSPFTYRIVAKLYSRRGQPQRALEEVRKGERLMQKSRRDDAFFLLEKVKLLRNIASYSVLIAQDAKRCGQDDKVLAHLQEAKRYLAASKNAIKELNKESEREANVEMMLWSVCRARYLAVSGKPRSAAKGACEALDLAGDLHEDDYAVRVRMFLYHLYMQMGDKDKAMIYHAYLLPLERHATGRFEPHYQNYVKPHVPELVAYVKEHYADQAQQTR